MISEELIIAFIIIILCLIIQTILLFKTTKPIKLTIIETPKETDVK